MLEIKYDKEPVILAVDDVEMNLMIVKRIMENIARVECVTSGRDALDYMEKNETDLVLLDLNMPDMNGFDVLKSMKSRDNMKEIPVVILTADVGPDLEMEGFAAGAVDFIRKPFMPAVALQRIKRILQYEYLQRHLKDEVAKQTALAEQRLKASQRLFEETVLALAKAIDANDKYTSGHSQRVAEYSRTIAAHAGMSPAKQQEVYHMGLLHDIGKIGIPISIINKTSRLTDDEYATIKTHTVIGAGILQTIVESPGLLIGASSHHERYDGRGYPDGLKGEEIPEEARIIAVADAYDAMTSKRSYRDTLSQAKVRAEIEKGRGTQFDPLFADIMLKLIDEDVDFKMQGTTLGATEESASSSKPKSED